VQVSFWKFCPAKGARLFRTKATDNVAFMQPTVISVFMKPISDRITSDGYEVCRNCFRF